MPFVTDEVWRRFGAGESIVVAPWPEPNPRHHFEDEAGLVEGFALLQEIITRVRQFRSDYEVPARAGLHVLVPAGALQLFVQEFREPIGRLAGIEAVDVVDANAGRAGAVRLLVGASEIFIPPGHGFDPEVARARIRKKLADVERDRDRVRAKLDNPNFVAKAPPEVRSKQEGDLASLDRRHEALTAQLEEMG